METWTALGNFQCCLGWGRRVVGAPGPQIPADASLGPRAGLTPALSHGGGGCVGVGGALTVFALIASGEPVQSLPKALCFL